MEQEKIIMYYDKRQLSREEFIKRFVDVDPTLYKELKNRDYKFYGSCMHNLADGLAQKFIYDSLGNKLFYVDVWCYIYDERYPRAERKVNTSIETNFYLDNDDDKYCTLQFSSKDLDFCERFFQSFFYNYGCRIYERAN